MVVRAMNGIFHLNNAIPIVVPMIPASRPPDILYANGLLISPWQSVVPPLKLTLISASLPSAIQTSPCPASCR